MIANMASVQQQQTLASAIHSVLSAAAEQICGLVERTVTEYEDRDVSSKLQIETQRRILDELLKPRVTLHRAVISETTASDSWNSARTRRLSSALSVLGRDCNGRHGRRKDSRSSSSSSAHGELHTEGLAASAAELRPPAEHPPVDIPSLSPTRATDWHGRTEEALSQTDSSPPPGVAAGAAKAKSPSLANAEAAPVVKANESLPHPSSLSPCHVTVQDSMESTPVDAMMDRGEAGQMMKRCDRFGPIQTKTKKDAKLDTSVSSCDDVASMTVQHMLVGPQKRGRPRKYPILLPSPAVQCVVKRKRGRPRKPWHPAEQTSDSTRRVVGNPKSTPPTVSKTAAPDDCNSVRIQQQQQPSCSGRGQFYSESQRRTEQQPPAAGRRSEPAADNIPSAPLTRSSSSTTSSRRKYGRQPKKASSDAAGSSGGKVNEKSSSDDPASMELQRLRDRGRDLQNECSFLKEAIRLVKDEETSVQKDVEDGQPSDRRSPESNLTPTTMVSDMSETTSASRDSGVLAKDSNAEPGGIMASWFASSSSSTRGDLCAEGLTGAGKQLPAESPTEVTMMTPQPSQPSRLSRPPRKYWRQPGPRPKKASSDAAGSSGGKAMDRELHLQHMLEEDCKEFLGSLGFPATDEETSVQKDVEDGQPSDRRSPESNLTPTTMVSDMSETTSASRDSGVLAKDSNAEPGGSMASQSASSSSTRGDLCAEGLTGAGKQPPAESPTEVVMMMMTPQPSSALSMDSSVLAKDSNAEPGGSKDSRTSSAQVELYAEPTEQQLPAHSPSSAEVMAVHPPPALVIDFSILEEYATAAPGGSEDSQSSSTRGALFSDGLTRTEKQLPEVMTPQVSPALIIDFSVLGKASEPGGSSVEPQSLSTRGELYSDALTSLDRPLPAESPTAVRDQQPSSDLSVDPGILGKDSIAEPAGSKDSQAPSAQGESSVKTLLLSLQVARTPRHPQPRVKFYSERLGSTEQQLPAESPTGVRDQQPSSDLSVDPGNLGKDSIASTRGDLCAEGLTGAGKQLPAGSPTEVVTMTPQTPQTPQPSRLSRPRQPPAAGRRSKPAADNIPSAPLTHSSSTTTSKRRKPAVRPKKVSYIAYLFAAGSKAPSAQGEFYSERLGSTEQQLPAESALDIPPATFARSRASNCREYGRPRNASPDTAGNGSQPPDANGRGQPRNTAAAAAAAATTAAAAAPAAAPVVKYRESVQRDRTLLMPTSLTFVTYQDSMLQAIHTRSVSMAREATRATELSPSPVKRSRLAIEDEDKEGGGTSSTGRGTTRSGRSKIEYFGFEDLVKSDSDEERTQATVVATEAALSTSMDVLQTQDTDFACTVCDKVFGLKAALTAHMSTHTAKPFSCTVCNKGFGHRSALGVHMSIHIPERKRKAASRVTILDSIVGRSMDLAREETREATEKMSAPPVQGSRLAIEDKEGGGMAVDGSRGQMDFFGFEDLGKIDSNEERTHAKVTMEAALSTSMDVLQTHGSQDNQSSSNTDFLHLPVCKEVVSTERQQRNPILVEEEPAPPPQSRGGQREEEEEELSKRPEEAHCSTLTLPAATSEDYNDNSWTEPLSSTSSETPDGGASQPTGEGQPLRLHWSESDSDEWEDTRGGTSSAGRGKTRAVTLHGAESDTEDGESEWTDEALQLMKSRGRQVQTTIKRTKCVFEQQ